MIFVTGPLFSGKKSYVKQRMGWDDGTLARRAVWDVQDLAARCRDLEALAAELAQKDVVMAVEVGGGVVPIDPAERPRGRRRAAWPACWPSGRRRWFGCSVGYPRC